MKLDNISNQVYIVAINEAKLKMHEYVTPEHFLYAILMFDLGKELIEKSGGDVKRINDNLIDYFNDNLQKNSSEVPIETVQFTRIFELAAMQVHGTSKNIIELGDLIVAMFNLQESYATYIMQKNGVSRLQMLKIISHDLKINEEKAKETEAAKAQRKNKEFLETFSTNMTEKAHNGLLDPLVGREQILERTIQVLSRRTKNNPIHVGDPGVGKTAIVEGLAQKIAADEVPEILKNVNLYYIDVGVVLAGTKYRGDFEERMIKLLDIISKEKSALVYFDEIHTIVGAGAVSGSSLDAAGLLKPHLTKGEIKFIGSTTFEEYKKYFEKDRALSRRFQRIDVIEPTVEETERILNGIKERYESYHDVVYSDSIIKGICKLSYKYMQDRYMPDKAIDVLDETGAYLRMKSDNTETLTVEEKDIERTVAQMAKVPEKSVSRNEVQNLKELEANLKTEIFGQDKAIETLVNAIKASRSGLSEIERPIANLMFVGPTGVGKTEISKKLADFLGINIIRFDMSEYQEKHSVARLIGSPPGYVGYEEGGLLTEVVRKTPYAVLLLDEIEKAHQDIYNIMLQIMDYGQLTDNIGKKADFRNIILIMTSNAGAREIGKKIIGFEDNEINISAIDTEVGKLFSPEFRNRLDEIIVFNHVDEDMSIKIVKKSISRLSKKLKEKDIELIVSDNAVKWIAEKGISKTYGAREINRLVDKEIKKPLVDEVLFGKLQNGGTSLVDIEDNKIKIENTEKIE